MNAGYSPLSSPEWQAQLAAIQSNVKLLESDTLYHAAICQIDPKKLDARAIARLATLIDTEKTNFLNLQARRSDSGHDTTGQAFRVACMLEETTQRLQNLTHAVSHVAETQLEGEPGVQSGQAVDPKVCQRQLDTLLHQVRAFSEKAQKEMSLSDLKAPSLQDTDRIDNQIIAFRAKLEQIRRQAEPHNQTWSEPSQLAYKNGIIQATQRLLALEDRRETWDRLRNGYTERALRVSDIVQTLLSNLSPGHDFRLFEAERELQGAERLLQETSAVQRASPVTAVAVQALTSAKNELRQAAMARAKAALAQVTGDNIAYQLDKMLTALEMAQGRVKLEKMFEQAAQLTPQEKKVISRLGNGPMIGDFNENLVRQALAKYLYAAHHQGPGPRCSAAGFAVLWSNLSPDEQMKMRKDVRFDQMLSRHWERNPKEIVDVSLERMISTMETCLKTPNLNTLSVADAWQSQLGQALSRLSVEDRDRVQHSEPWKYAEKLQRDVTRVREIIKPVVRMERALLALEDSPANSLPLLLEASKQLQQTSDGVARLPRGSNLPARSMAALQAIYQNAVKRFEAVSGMDKILGGQETDLNQLLVCVRYERCVGWKGIALQRFEALWARMGRLRQRKMLANPVFRQAFEAYQKDFAATRDVFSSQNIVNTSLDQISKKNPVLQLDMAIQALKVMRAVERRVSPGSLEHAWIRDTYQEALEKCEQSLQTAILEPAFLKPLLDAQMAALKDDKIAKATAVKNYHSLKSASSHVFSRYRDRAYRQIIADFEAEFLNRPLA